MEISSSCNDLTTSQSVNSLFLKDNTGILLEELDESEVSLLLQLTKAFILDKSDVLDYQTDEEVLTLIREYSTEIFQDAVEGLAIIVKQNQLNSLLELDSWLEKEEERCLGFLRSPQPLAQN